MEPTTNQENEGRCLVPLRLERLAASEEKPDGRREYRVCFITAGRVRRRDGKEALWEIPPETIKAAIEAGRFDRLTCFVDHTLQSWVTDYYPSLRNMFGVTLDGTTWDETSQSAVGVIRTYDTEAGRLAQEILDQIVADQQAGRETPDVGGSLVFYPRDDYRDIGETPGVKFLRVTVEIVHTVSWDIVFGPGAKGRVLEVLSSQAPNGVSNIPLPILNRKDGVSMDPEEEKLNSNVTPPAPVAAAAPAAAVPVPAPAPALGAPAEDRLARIEANLERLTSILAQAEEPAVVQGMGTPPRDPAPGRINGMRTSMDQFTPVVSWLFGDPEAPYPDPQFRRADMIYMALTGDYEWRGVFDSGRVMLAGATTTDLPNLAVNAMNKVILLQYASLKAYRWYEYVVAITPNDGSVQNLTLISTGGVGELPTVAEKGPYTELSMSDAKETASFVKKGGYIGITLEMFRNSEIAKIQAVPVGLARSSVMTRSTSCASVFTANAGIGPTLATDSKALFHADHGNLATTAFGTDSTAWNAVDLAIWSQTELGSGKPLAISPKYWLGHRSGFRQALITFGYGDGQPTTYVPEAVDRGPDDPRPWPIAVPDFSDTNDWAAIVDPKLFPVICMSYAQGAQGNTHPAPELYAVTSETQGLVFTNDTFPVKVRDWFALGVNGYRGIAKRNVA